MGAQCSQFRSGLKVALVGVVITGGCRSVDGPDGPFVKVPAEKNRTKKLTDPEVAEVQFAIGRALEKRGELGQATAAYRAALKHDQTCADAYHRLAVMRDQEGKFQESRDLYQKALAARPGNPDLYCNMGYSLYLQHCWREAEMNLRQAIALAPDHHRAHNNLGLVLARAGRDDDALVEFRRAGCGEADSHINLAYALTLENHSFQAREHYEQALNADPSSMAAKKGLEELDALSAKGDLASRTVEKPPEQPPDSAVSLTKPHPLQPVSWTEREPRAK